MRGRRRSRGRAFSHCIKFRVQGQALPCLATVLPHCVTLRNHRETEPPWRLVHASVSKATNLLRSYQQSWTLHHTRTPPQKTPAPSRLRRLAVLHPALPTQNPRPPAEARPTLSSHLHFRRQVTSLTIREEMAEDLAMQIWRLAGWASICSKRAYRCDWTTRPC